MTRHRPGAGMAPMEGSKLLIVCAAIILLIAISLSAISTKPHGPGTYGRETQDPAIDRHPSVCDALRTQLDWDDPAYRLLCSETGGGRNGG